MTTDTPTTPYATLRRKQKAQTRAMVLKVAQELFITNGYEATGIRDIARECGMSTGAVNQQCSGKEELYLTVMGHKPVPSEDGRVAIAALAAMAVKHNNGTLSADDLDGLSFTGLLLAESVGMNKPDPAIASEPIAAILQAALKVKEPEGF